MSDLDQTAEQLLKAIEAAEQERERTRMLEAEARRNATAAENALIHAEKVFVDYLVSKAPRVADEVAKRRGRR